MAIDRTKLAEQLEDDAERLLELRRQIIEDLVKKRKVPYARTLLNAAEQALDRIIGKPKQAVEQSGSMVVKVVRE